MWLEDCEQYSIYRDRQKHWSMFTRLGAIAGIVPQLLAVITFDRAHALSWTTLLLLLLDSLLEQQIAVLEKHCCALLKD